MSGHGIEYLNYLPGYKGETWNPVTGCGDERVSASCANCWARGVAETRLRSRHGYDADDPFKVTLRPERLDQPLRWRKPRFVATCFMGDLFHAGVPFDFIDEIFGSIERCFRHIFLILTKRPERMAKYSDRNKKVYEYPWPENAWAGVTVEKEEQLKRVDYLMEMPASVRFASFEPLLGPVDIKSYLPMELKPDLSRERQGIELVTTIREPGLDWVIVGGESGPTARPMHPDWARRIRDDCAAAGVPVFFKQWGGRRNKKAGRLLDGKQHDGMPSTKS